MVNTQDQVTPLERTTRLELGLLFQFIPQFKSEANEAFNFIQNCENAHTLSQEDQRPALLAYIKSKISGNASTILMNKNIRSWPDLKNELNKIFRESYSTLSLHRELISLHQKSGETVMQYTQKCESLQRRLLQNAKSGTTDKDWEGKSTYIKQNILDAFINGLNEKIGNYTNIRKPKDLNEASSFAKEEESRLGNMNLHRDYSNRNTVKINFNQIRCETCGRTNHKTWQCFRNNRQRDYPKRNFGNYNQRFTNKRNYSKPEDSKPSTSNKIVNDTQDLQQKMQSLNFRKSE